MAPVNLHTDYLPARHVQERYRVSGMTLWRWLERPDLDFPRPLYINKRRYWRLADLDAWERRRAMETDPRSAIADEEAG